MLGLALSCLVATAAPLVAIDPGHGGDAEGTHGVCGIREKDVVLAISRELQGVLAASKQVEAMLVRQGDVDVPLDGRAARAKQMGASLLVSNHANASLRPEHAGRQTYFLSRKA